MTSKLNQNKDFQKFIPPSSLTVTTVLLFEVLFLDFEFLTEENSRLVELKTTLGLFFPKTQLGTLVNSIHWH